MENQSAPLVPTFEGHISTTLDALILFEACLTGVLNHVPRRPHDRERQELIKSGNIFIYEEHSSGIKRWTDGVSWSPSRILGNFLIYRELDKPFPPGEKKRALKKCKKSPQGIVKAEPLSTLNMPFVAAGLDQSGNSKDQERSLIGSLVDSYSFKDNGLVKKTISVAFNGVTHHMVSYYNVDDVTSGKLETPSSSVHLRGITPRAALLLSQNFRTPVHEVEYTLATDNAGAMPSQYGPDHASINGGTGVLHRAMMQGNLQSAMNLNNVHHQSGSSPSYMFPQHATTTPNGYPTSHSTSTQHGYPPSHPTGTHDGYPASHTTGAQNSYAGHVAHSSFQAAMPQQMSYGGNAAGNYSLYHHMDGAPGEVWNFPGLDGDSDQQYYAQGHVQWPNGPNSLHRT